MNKYQERLAKFRAENPELYKEPTRCRRCNRILTDPISIKAGIGPECTQKLAEELLEENAE